MTKTGKALMGAGWLARTGAAAMVVLAAVSAQAQMAVSPSGMATYSYPIAVPPGIGGLAPKLALTYASGGGHGQFGMGWSLQGLSVISRCAASLAVDGKRGGISNTASDKLCLDGKRLIPTDATGAPLVDAAGDAAGLATAGAYREYRTEGDSFARVRAYGMADATSAAAGPAYFKVWTKSGEIYEYGHITTDTVGDNAYVVAQGSKIITSWLVARIGNVSSSTTTNDNYIRFTYVQTDAVKNFGSGTDSGGQSAYPAHATNLREINYSNNRITFLSLFGLPDQRESYAVGARTVTKDRFDSISVYTNVSASTSQRIRMLNLTYDLGAVSKRSTLKSIQECFGNGTQQCLPATSFTYNAGGNATFQANTSFKSTLGTLPMHDKGGAYGVMVADFNADGKTDLLRWSKTAGGNLLYTSNGDGTFTQVLDTSTGGKFNLTNQVFNDGANIKSMVADFNGDGVPDIFRFNNSTGVSDLFLGNGDGSFTQKSVNRTSSQTIYRLQRESHLEYCDVALLNGSCLPRSRVTWSSGWNFYILDANGDGKLDIVQAYLPNRSTSVYSNGGVAPALACYTGGCTRVFLGDGQGNFAENTAAATNNVMFVDPSARLGEPGLASDLNGDQLPDFLSMWDGDAVPQSTAGSNNYYTYYSNGDGTFTAKGNGWLSMAPRPCLPIDYNGDGKADCLLPNGSPVLSVATGVGSLTTGNFNRATEVNAAKGVLPLDLNGDGLDDLLLLSDAPATTPNAVYLSNGGGTFTATTSSDFNLAATRLQTSDSTAANSAVLTFGDFSGKGSLEMLRLVDAPASSSDDTMNQLYSKADPTPADILKVVTSGLGSTNSVKYEPLTNTSRYTRDRGTANAAAAPNFDLIYPLYVVVSQDTDVGAGNTPLRTEFAYTGLKGNLQGRGATGFREVRRQSLGADGTTKLTTVTSFLQDHPYIGSPSKTVTFVGNLTDAVPSSSTALSTTTNLYCDSTSAAGADATAKNTTGISCPTTAKVVRPYLLRSIAEGRDLAGNALPKTTTEMSVNNTGDPLVTTVTTEGTTAGVAQTFVKKVTNTYKTDVTTCDASDSGSCKWILGRLDTTTTDSSVPNSMAAIATSAGTSTNASATSGTVPSGQNQITNTQMMQRLIPILNLLLSD